MTDKLRIVGGYVPIGAFLVVCGVSWKVLAVVSNVNTSLASHEAAVIRIEGQLKQFLESDRDQNNRLAIIEAQLKYMPRSAKDEDG